MNVLHELEGKTSKLVYLYVKQHDTVTVDEVKEELGLKCMTVLTVVQKLIQLGYLERIKESADFRIRASL